ncbi:MAG: outer membrane beta-barrel protein [Chitinophagales bacterium]|nr:outer membrane beta-barrel protein [Chitinophagales bacterium]
MINFISISNAQGVSISGKVSDSSDAEVLIGASVILLNSTDSIQLKGTVTDIDGSYLLSNINTGNYIIKVAYMGYETLSKPISVISQNIRKLDFALLQDAKVLSTVEIDAIMPRMVLKGDTSQFNAEAFKVNADADVGDLVTKMPGVMIQDGKVQAQGEQVRKVLVDGKEFFGDDAMMTLKNLPANIVDKIQVYDNLSEQAQFTGFNDGNTEKVINIITKEEVKDGMFGRAYLGYGWQNRYSAGGNWNYFKDARRISVLGLSNNINIQNFNNEDLVGVALSTKSKPSGGRGRGGGMSGRGGFGDNNVGNFLTSGSGGINWTNGIGVNYVEEWKKDVKLSADYFFNHTKNENNSSLDRQYLAEDFSQNYSQIIKQTSHNYQHRFNAKLDYDIDDKKSLTFRPNITFQNNQQSSIGNALTQIINGNILAKSDNDNSSTNKAYNISNSLLYKHKLAKQGRTFSVRLESKLNNKMVDNYLIAQNIFSDNLDSIIFQNQWTDGLSKTLTLGSELSYTEPIGDKSQLKIEYSPGYSHATSDRYTYFYDEQTHEYSIVDLNLSNVFKTINWVQRTGLSYRFKAEKLNFNFGVNYQYSSLLSDKLLPIDLSVDKRYHNFLPTAQMGYKFSKNNNLSLFYRTYVRSPNVAQLQDVVDNTNPLLLTSGNKDLNQQYSHTIGMRWRFAQPMKGRSAFAMISSSLNNQYITNATLLASRDTIIGDNIVLPAGGQWTRPVNVNGNWSLNSVVNFGTPLLFMKSNLNLFTGFNFNKVPNYINSSLYFNNSYNFNSGIVLGSNISEKIDFRISYTSNYNIVKYSQNTSTDNNFYSGLVNAAVNISPWKGWVYSSSFSYNHYAGLSDSYNLNDALWNMALGYKFLKKNNAEVNIQVVDILGKNNNVSRTNTETYIEDSRVNVLGRYFLVQFSYKFNKYKGLDKNN